MTEREREREREREMRFLACRFAIVIFGTNMNY